MIGHLKLRDLSRLLGCMQGRRISGVLGQSVSLWAQLDATLVERDWRWNCQRSFEMTMGGGLAELFFIDTTPAVQKYYERPWANFTGMTPPAMS